MTKITIEHDSSTGNVFIKHFSAKAALLDYGFELHKKRHLVLKLVSTSPLIRPYYILGLEEKTIQSIAQLINKGVPELTVPHAAFDRTSVPNTEVLKLVPTKLKQYLETINYVDYMDTDAFAIFHPKERELLKNTSPIWRKNHAKVVSLWAKTMPAHRKPVEISKTQYFEAILYNSRPINYHKSFSIV
jgi:hypothetical protein